MQTQAAVASSPFADILPMLDHLPAMPAAANREALQNALQTYQVMDEAGLDILGHLQQWQKKTPTLNHPRLLLFASHYADGDNAKRTQKTITDLQGEHHPLKRLAANINADLRVYELDIAHSHRGPADAAQAMTYGMLSIEDKGDALVIGTLSDGAEQAAQRVQLSGANSDALLHDLAPQMGLDFFAALGACLAARLAGQPVILSGAFGALLQQVLTRLDDDAAAHARLLSDTAWPPLFAAVQALQQSRFLLAFLPVAHVQLV